MKKHHDIKEVRFDKDELILSVDGKVIRVNLKSISPKLKSASDSERKDFSISPSGYGIHWPQLDEDLSIDGLLQIQDSSHSRLKKVKSTKI